MSKIQEALASARRAELAGMDTLSDLELQGSSLDRIGDKVDDLGGSIYAKAIAQWQIFLTVHV